MIQLELLNDSGVCSRPVSTDQLHRLHSLSDGHISRQLFIVRNNWPVHSIKPKLTIIKNTYQLSWEQNRNMEIIVTLLSYWDCSFKTIIYPSQINELPFKKWIPHLANKINSEDMND